MRTPFLLALSLLAAPAPLLAQIDTNWTTATDPRQPSIFDGDYLTIGAGAAVLPTYEGSDNYVVTPAPIIRGSFGGIDIASRGTALTADIIPGATGSRVNVLFGPEVRLNFDRTGRIRDTVVAALGEKDIAIEAGGFAGIAFNGLTNPFDTLTARVDLVTDISGQHDGTTITPSVNFATPLSRGIYAFVQGEATHADDNYADSFFSVTPAGTLASGLPTYSARGGWKNWAVSTGVNVELDGDLSNGGLGVFVGGSYSRLLEDASRSPIVTLRGSRDQWFGAAGLTFSF